MGRPVATSAQTVEILGLPARRASPLIVESWFLRVGGVGLFVFYWWDHADCGVQAPWWITRISTPADPGEDPTSGLVACREAALVGELSFEGGEKRLADAFAPRSSPPCRMTGESGSAPLPGNLSEQTALGHQIHNLLLNPLGRLLATMTSSWSTCPKVKQPDRAKPGTHQGSVRNFVYRA